jgi:hypothetical protein
MHTGRHHVVDVSADSTQHLIAPMEEREKFLSKAFITFKTFTSATVARQVVHMQLVGMLYIMTIFITYVSKYLLMVTI